MRFSDYLRLGVAGIVAHKRRALLVVAISGVMFAVIIAAFILMQGTQNAVYREQLKATDGKIVYRVLTDESLCAVKGCTEGAEQAMRELAMEYGGEILDNIEAYQTTAGVMYAVPESLVKGGIEVGMEEMPEEAVPTLMATGTVARWLRLDNGVKQKLSTLLETATKARERALGRVITDNAVYGPHEELPEMTDEGKTKFYIVGLLPGAIGSSTFSLQSITGLSNPLDMIFSAVNVGVSKTLLIQDGKLKEMLESVETENEIWVSFSDRKAAYEFAIDERGRCMISTNCKTKYNFLVENITGDFVNTERNFQAYWTALSVVAMILGGIAIIITVTTFMRLVGQDEKVIALYRATGATSGQIRMIYLVYLMGLSLLAAGFALVVGLLLALIMNAANMGAMTDMFTLGFGISAKEIWILGWNWRILAAVGAMMVAGPGCVLFSLRKLK